MKVLLNSFSLNDHTLGFHPQTLKLESPFIISLDGYNLQGLGNSEFTNLIG